MYGIMIAMDNRELETELCSLSMWGKASCFKITASISYADIDALAGFELVIADKKIGSELLQTARLKKKHIRVVLCSSDPDFETARQGIVLGAYDYITAPFDLSRIHSLLSRVENELRVDEVTDLITFEQIKEKFFDRDTEFDSLFDDICSKFTTGTEDIARSAKKLVRFYDNLLSELLERHQWFDLYTDDTTVKIDRPLTDRERFDLAASKIKGLFRDFCELYPHHNIQLQDVIDTILNYPEGDLRQKTLSAQLHINSTYLSTVFLAQTGIRFVNYVNTVKLKRAAWLLTNTDLGITEIAKRLDYKDNSYFSMLFRKKFGIVPSVYRIPPSYDFQI